MPNIIFAVNPFIMKRICICAAVAILLLAGFSPADGQDYASYNSSILGSNVYLFNPSMKMNEIQVMLDTIFSRQSARSSEFTDERYALLFSPGNYDLDVKVGYYMQVVGLGHSPEDVVINGAVRSNSRGRSVLVNFWRAVENMTIIPSDTALTWGVSQAAPMRRVYVKGNMNLFDIGYASGGFLADSKVDGVVSFGPQQQWFTRNSQVGEWVGGNWNMMFVGVPGAPDEDWPEKPYTTIEKTPLVREKPFLTNENGRFFVTVPGLKINSKGPDWLNNTDEEKVISIDEFYIARPGIDNSGSINYALKEGKNLLFSPGIYNLSDPIKVTRKNTVLMGLGMPSLVPLNGKAAMEVSDVDGVTISGILLDAGAQRSEVLLQVGEPGSAKDHSADPTFLFDVFIRVGGPHEGSVKSAVIINSNNTVIDHIWLWRADHGNGVGWDKNRCANGLIVNGDNVTVYGLFNEHNQEYQTLWIGEGGKVYFYQSEMPYDPPTAEAWTHDGINGYASYKVTDHVKTHEAWGLGIYNVFYQAPVIVDNAIETPEYLENFIHHMVIFWLNGNKESEVKSIINGKGGPVNLSVRKATLP